MTSPDGRLVRLRHYPAPASPAWLDTLAARPQVQPHRDRLARLRAGGLAQLIVRVDRTDPSKNIPLGFAAYELLLARHPELAGRILFSAILPESRTGIPAYRDEIAEIKAAARRLNQRFAASAEIGPITSMGAGWRPVEIQLTADSDLMIALYEDYDVQLANSVRDGMHLGAKEAPYLSCRNWVSILSRTLGAYPELAQYALGVDPRSRQELADRFWQALTMPAAERAERLAGSRRVVISRGNRDWWAEQLHDLRPRAPPPGSGAS